MSEQLTKREHFAALIAAGFFSNYSNPEMDQHEYAKRVVVLTDAVLVELERTKEDRKPG